MFLEIYVGYLISKLNKTSFRGQASWDMTSHGGKLAALACCPTKKS